MVPYGGGKIYVVDAHQVVAPRPTTVGPSLADPAPTLAPGSARRSRDRLAGNYGWCRGLKPWFTAADNDNKMQFVTSFIR
jgi:hypothetical protein